MSNRKKIEMLYVVSVQFKGFRHNFEVCAVDVPAACRAVKKKIAESDEYTGDYYIEECSLYR